MTANELFNKSRLFNNNSNTNDNRLHFRPPPAARPADGHEPGRPRRTSPRFELRRDSVLAGFDPEQARAEAEVGLEGQPGSRQRGSQRGRTLDDQGREEGHGSRASDNSPGFNNF